MKERIIWSLVLIIVLAFGIQAARPESEADKQFQWQRLWIYKTHSNRKYDCVIYGDSRVYRGISASAVENNLKDASAFNLAYSSGSFSSFMLDKVESRLNANAKVPIILLGITPYALTPKAIKDSHIRQELARKKEEVLEYLYFTPVKRFFYPISLETIKTHAFPDTVIDTYYHQESYVNEGWVASWKIPADPKAALPGYVKDFEQNVVSPASIDTLIIRVRNWTSKGIAVFGFRPPTTDDMVALETRLSGFNESDFVTRFENAGGVWFRLGNDYESYDGSHLSKTSAIQVSEKLGALITSELSTRAIRRSK